MFYRDTYSKIDLDTFQENLVKLQKKTNKQVFCVCKANAYSHGDYHIAQCAYENGSQYICVSSLDEAISLRRQSFKGNILVLGYVAAKDIQVVLDEDIAISVISKEWIEQVSYYKEDLSKLVVHIKIDTGMNRIGFKKLTDIEASFDMLLKLHIQIEGIFTHFHSADNKDKSSCEKQMHWFYGIVDKLDYDFKWIHTSNSDASLSFVDERSNATRIGLALYGIKSVETPLELRPVLSLYSTIVHIKEVKANETVGYGATYKCLNDSIIATLPIGYGDGFIRKNQGRFVCIDSHPYEIVGLVCMDQTMIRVDRLYKVGTSVEIIGEHIPITKMANELEMIPYEVLCLLNDRITKIIIQNGKEIDVINGRIPK